MSEAKTLSRRSFFQYTLTAAIATPMLMSSAELFAQAKCPATPPAGKMVAKVGEGMAKSLHYVEDAKTSKHAKYKAGSDCANCKFYNKAKLEGGYAPCTMMGMRYVSGCGWCTTYSLKA